MLLYSYIHVCIYVPSVLISTRGAHMGHTGVMGACIHVAVIAHYSFIKIYKSLKLYIAMTYILIGLLNGKKARTSVLTVYQAFAYLPYL